MFDLVILLSVLLMGSCALIVNKNKFSFGVLFVFVMLLVWREFSVDVFFRTLMSQHALKGTWNIEYKDGAASILEFVKATRSYVLLVSLFLCLIFARSLIFVTKNDKKR